ncbi:MAG: DUF192 domain-containing protein [Kiritimatiellia bacterium]|jgi:uncharacterized membrane protein (UPF0127 family)
MKADVLQIPGAPPWICLVAASWHERARGLLGRDGLDEGVCLLLKPCRLVHTFGMRFALDLVFLDAKNRVVKCVRNVRPGRIRWGGFRARATLEAQAGWLPALPTGTVVVAPQGAGGELKSEHDMTNRNRGLRRARQSTSQSLERLEK